MTETDDNLKRFIGVSSAIHIAAIIFLVLRGTLLAPPAKVYVPSLRVDLVALPDQKKNDLPPAQETAQTKPEEKRPDLKLDVKPTNEGEISLKKKKASSRKEKEAQEKLKNALARIKALERIKMMAGQQVKGNAISKGSSLSGDAKASLETTYYDVVLERVRNYWELPKWLQDQNLSAQVTVYIDRNGQITKYIFTKPSGNESFDSEVKRTLQSAVPFPEPPIAIIPDVSQQGIVLGFPI
ncbi:MAG: TonB family protein [Bdellovibrionales bacterium]|nr:TonB family protein [Bdellovibrionales bacterium]